MDNKDSLIENSNIKFDILIAKELYQTHGEVSFELLHDEYEAFKSLIRSFRSECKKDDFDITEWVKEKINENGTMDGGTAPLIFSFLISHGSKARILTDTHNSMYIVTLRDRTVS